MRILCVTSVKNEAPYLLEWVAHNQAIGVTDFLIYSNDCADGTDQVLDALEQSGIVTHVPQQIPDGESPQWHALRAAWKHPLRKECDWALVCDVDEFVNIHVGAGTFPELFGAVPDDTDGILLPWRLFGHNGHAFFTDAPVTQQFTSSMPKDCSYPIAATFFKSVIRPSGPFNQFGVHRPKQKQISKSRIPVWVNGGGQRLPDVFARNPQRLSLYGLPNDRSLVECNHYSLKSAESFLVKRQRGLPNRSHKNIDLAYWVERNFNGVENRSILKLADKTMDRRAKLMAVPGLQNLHDHAVAWHKSRFLEVITQEEERRLFGQILLSAGSHGLPADLSRQMVKWYQQGQKNAAK